MNINNSMARQPHHDNNYGGARAGAGRPKGTGNKIRLEDLLDSIEVKVGRSYAEQLAENYAGAVQRSDWARVENYDRAFLNKVVADKQEVTTVEGPDAVEQRAQAFAEALKALVNKNMGK